jgi:uncharacterized protein YdaU (DUF1376 family)
MDWYPFYPALYRSHTMHLTAEQDGIYRRLIDYYMESRQPLPDNDFALARIASVDTDCFKHASSILRAFFEQSNGLLKHKKCDELLDEQDLKSKFYAKRAKKAASIRHGKTKDLCLKHATSNSEAMLGDATITITDNNKKVSKDTYREILPDWMPLAEWEAFKEMRRKNKKPMTAHAEKLVIGKIDKYRNAGHDPTILLNQSILNGWQDIYEPKENKNAAYITNTTKPTWTSTGKQLSDRYAAEAERLEREEEAIAIGNVGQSLRIAETIRQN